jgi:hypothetical protein
MHLDVRAWAAYSIRALWLLAVAIISVIDLMNRGRGWLWTERAAFGLASFFACCWVYDEFVVRPAFDRTERVIFLATWLIVLGLAAGALIRAWAAFGSRIMRLNTMPYPRGRSQSPSVP